MAGTPIRRARGGLPAPATTERGEKQPPFELDNEARRTHGAYMERLIAPLAAEKVDGVMALAAAPDSPIAYLLDPSYQPAIAAWARVEAQLDQVIGWLAERASGSLLDDEGDIRPAANLLGRLETQAERLRARLGLDPLARARLGRDVAAGSVDMAALMAKLAEKDPT